MTTTKQLVTVLVIILPYVVVGEVDIPYAIMPRMTTARRVWTPRAPSMILFQDTAIVYRADASRIIVGL